MLGFLALSDGALFMLFGGGNIHQISRRIGRGQVDHMLMQPVPIWMQILADGFTPVTGSIGLLAGLGITAYATAKVGVAVTPLWLMEAALLVATRIGIEMGLSFLLASSAFYKPVACEEISSVGHDVLSTVGRYPLNGLSAGLTAVLLTVVPAGLMAWFPSLILLKKIPVGPAILVPVAVAAALLALATCAFKKGLRHYAKYSCNRYRDMGHRV
jgi:ABC-2 type transport system permease protein